MGNDHWTIYELNIIKQRSPNEPDRWLPTYLPGRSKPAISAKRRRLGVSHNNKWIAEQVRKFHAFC